MENISIVCLFLLRKELWLKNTFAGVSYKTLWILIKTENV